MNPQIPEKASTFAWVLRLKKNPVVHWGFKVVLCCVFLGILIVWGIDGLNLASHENDFVTGLELNASQAVKIHQDFDFTNLSDKTLQGLPQTLQNPAPNLPENGQKSIKVPSFSSTPAPSLPENGHKAIKVPSFSSVISVSPQTPANLSQDGGGDSPGARVLRWVSAELEANYSANLLANWLTPGGEPCKETKTVEISIPSLDGVEGIELQSGEIHEFVFQALDDEGKPHCLGGDYFETDLSGDSWKSRPPVKDFGNGTYQFTLQIHPDYAGEYNLTVILLFRHYEGLKFSPERFAFDKVLRVIPLKFTSNTSQLPQIEQCRKSDLVKDVWSGRWTRHAKNDSCEISNDGRYRCLEANFPCQNPWCDGPLGLLESNGWVYSTHCSFKMFTSQEAWDCLSGRWIFWWGDSNHCDTIRNLLSIVLGLPNIPLVPRRYDENITNPLNPSQVVHFTSIFNGHPNASGNYEGLNSLINAEYRELIKEFFVGEIVPDTVIMNSGLHDGVHWPNVRQFIRGADYAVAFWKEVMEGVKGRGAAPPRIIYRTTVATGGYARRLAFNPHKMEVFNGVVLDKLRGYGLIDLVIDDFDMTYPWHYDNRCNDGVHYGRAPAKMRWRDGQVGHQYFVDLMLGHVLLTALCSSS